LFTFQGELKKGEYVTCLLFKEVNNGEFPIVAMAAIHY